MEISVLGERLHRRDLLSLRLNRKNRAGVDGFVVHQDGARSALPAVAYALGSGEVQAIPQSVEESHARFKARLVLLPVHGEFHRNSARTVDLHLLSGSHYHLGAGDRRHSSSGKAGNLQEVPAGNARRLLREFFSFLGDGIVVLHSWPPRSGEVPAATTGLRLSEAMKEGQGRNKLGFALRWR